MLGDFLSLIFPNLCATCDGSLSKGEECICTICRTEFPVTKYHLTEDETYNPLAKRFYGKIDLKYTFSYLHFSRMGMVQRLLHELKYQGGEEIGELVGKWYGKDLRDAGYEKEFDLIIPVPLHISKLRQRGFNQADAFARGLSVGLGVPYDSNLLKRVVSNTTQTKKNRSDRWKNVEGIFEVITPNSLQGKRVLIVDDVLTTGATLEACAYEIKKNGSTEISVATIAAA